MYAIKHIRRYYAPQKTDSAPIFHYASGEPLVFATRAEARKHIDRLKRCPYYLVHNQHGYDLQIVDLDKPRNARWFTRGEG